jgi:helicase
MQIDDVDAPGLNDELKSALHGWGIERFTAVQRIALEAGCANETSMVVCAPTSGGKTLVAEMALFKAVSRGRRCIYLVSHKALADQKYLDFERRFGSASNTPHITVGLSTGDRDEGEASPRILVSTYEKALALLLAGQIDPSAALVIADELQIIGEPGRGPNIETLCAILRQKELYQIVALTATVGNASDLAHWLECELVLCTERDVSLHQEIWSQGRVHSTVFGSEDGQERDLARPVPSDVLQVTRSLLADGRGPVLVFTESRNEAAQFAENFSQGQSRTAEGIAIAEQLDLFSEPTESSEQLQENAQRKVAFHTADLTAQERQVIESGFLDDKFEVCFATSTLAAGVNFPFQTVVFPKLTYEWGGRQGTNISRSDYRNMSGRAGRLGMHDVGYAILLPSNQNELRWAQQLVLPENERVSSQLVDLSMRRTVLTLIASRVVADRPSMKAFFQNTFFWYEIREHNPHKLDDILVKADRSVDWLIDNGLIEPTDDALIATPFGKATAQSGLLPATAVEFRDLMQDSSSQISADFERHVTGLIHWACGSPEFRSDHPSRFLVYPSGRRPVSSNDFLQSRALLRRLDRTDNQLSQCAHAISMYADGAIERQIRFQTNIPSGGVHRLAVDVAWVLDGLHRIATAPELSCPQTLTNQIAMLARRVRWGAPAEVLDIIRVAQKNSVPGFGRQRAMALLAQGLTTFEQILSTARETLTSILRSEQRTSAFVDAMSNSIGFRADRYSRIHSEVAAQLGLKEVVDKCNDALGTEYEEAIKTLLEAETRWVVRVLDDGRQQNVPDIMLQLGNRSVLIECKTTTKKPPLIKKEEAFAVLQKAVDFEQSARRVTLGKPMFDEHSKKKVQGASDISLVEHAVFVEGALRVLTGVITPEGFLDWVTQPGLVEIERLGGEQTIEIARKGEQQ